jgi:hypothetical protein
MKRDEFYVGLEFWCGGKRWRCTDVGSRVIVAISLEPHEIVSVWSSEANATVRYQYRRLTDDPVWHNGPPYAIVEEVFDEYSLPGCSPASV